MQKEENYSGAADAGASFQASLDYSSPQNPVYHGRTSSSYEQAMRGSDDDSYRDNRNSVVQGGVMVNYMQNNSSEHSNAILPYEQQQKWQQQLMLESNNCINSEMPAVDRTLSFADVMQFADFGPKLALHHPQHECQQHQQSQDQDAGADSINREGDSTGVDPVYFLKFPVLSNQIMMQGHGNSSHNHANANNNGGFDGGLEEISGREFSYNNQEQDGAVGTSTAGANNYNNPVQLEFLGNAGVTNTDENVVDISGDKIGVVNVEGGTTTVGKSSNHNKRKRPRTIKTTEEVESQRMTHIAVERNRRKQMNEHLRVLRSLMPSSYVQRGDQASIIGGAIEFVRELEQLLQCLESQKRRRLYGDQPAPPRPVGDSTSTSTVGLVPQSQDQLGFPPALSADPSHQDDQLRLVDELDPAVGAALLREETAESKSCIADVEVKVLGFDALIKILSRRRSGQLVKAIAALEDLHFTILHTNITTIEQTVLYSFNVKVASEARFTAEDIASSVQQIFSFIHANTNIM